MLRPNRIFVSTINKLISQIRQVNVFKRLFISFLILITLPTIAITIITYNTYTKEIEKNISAELSYTNHNVAQAITQQMQYYENLVYNLYMDETLMQLVFDSLNTSKSALYQKKIEDTINNQLYHYIPYHDTSVFNLQIITPRKQFTQTSSSGDKKGGTLLHLGDFLDSPYYAIANSFKGHPVWFDTTREETLFYKQGTISKPITDCISLTQSIPNYYFQNSVGVIVLNVYLNGVIDNINKSLLDRRGHLMLVSSNGSLASLNLKLKGPIPKDIPSLLHEINNELEGVLTTMIDGKTCLVSYEKLLNSDFYVLNLAYFDSLIQTAEKIKNFTLIMMIIVIIVAIIISYIVTLSITLPLNKLKRVLGKVPLKGFDITFDDNSHDEIGILGNHFNDMVGQIQELINKVYLSEIHAQNLAFKKKKAELNALQMQINPHFLYNTLDIIRWEIIGLEDGNGKVSQMVESFSSFLRLSIPKHTELVPISEEVKHIDSYLQVINFRYSTSKVTLVNELDTPTLKFCVPKLTLQPIIENCILHGFKGSVNEKIITLKSIITEDTLLIYISDNGIGMCPNTLRSLNDKLSTLNPALQNSIGLYNVCERIQLYFGTDYGLSIAEAGPQGTTLEIRLPLHHLSSEGGINHV